MPTAHPLPVQNLRNCQIEGITILEASFAAAHPRALIQMSAPEIIAQDITDDLEAALEQFRLIAEDLK